MLRHLGAFLLRLAASAALLMLAVGWVSPGNPRNTFWRAVAISAFLSLAWFVTLARFLWFLFVPWLLYAAVWLATVMAAYGLGFLRSLLLALALTFLTFLVSLLFGIETL
jgi:putative membrane protein